MQNQIDQGQGELFPENHSEPFDLAQYAGRIAETAPRFVPPDQRGVHQDVTGVKPGAGDVNIHGPGSRDWEKLRSRVG